MDREPVTKMKVLLFLLSVSLTLFLSKHITYNIPLKNKIDTGTQLVHGYDNRIEFRHHVCSLCTSLFVNFETVCDIQCNEQFRYSNIIWTLLDIFYCSCPFSLIAKFTFMKAVEQMMKGATILCLETDDQLNTEPLSTQCPMYHLKSEKLNIAFTINIPRLSLIKSTIIATTPFHPFNISSIDTYVHDNTCMHHHLKFSNCSCSVGLA